MLPSYIANAEAQAFGEQVELNGATALLRQLEVEPHERNRRRLAMACEIVAASIGYPCQPERWCFFAENWLYSSGYTADESTVNLARESLKRLEQTGAAWNESWDDLQDRLSREPKQMARVKPTLTQADAKRLARSFGSPGSCDVQQKGFYGSVPTRYEAVQIIAYRKFTEFVLAFDGYPNTDSIDALRILLLGSKHTLRRLDCRYGHHVDRNDPVTDPQRTLSHCKREIQDLESLECLTITDLYIDDEIIRWFAQGKKIEVFRAEQQSPDFQNQIEVTAEGIKALVECRELQSVKISSPRLKKNKEAQKLLAEFFRKKKH